MARWLGLGLGRSGCTGCGRRRADRRCARRTLLRLRPVLPRALLSGAAACLLRLSSAAAGYPPPAPGYAAPPGASAGDPVAYCTQRYRSYNPQTGTYLGTDGQRHHCP